MTGNLFDIRSAVVYSSPMRPQPKIVPERDEEYKAFIRTFPCSKPGCRMSAPSVAHHHPLAGHSGMGTTTSDYRTVPLCVPHHIPGVHQYGKLTFWGDLDAVEDMITRFNLLYFSR